jgi:branched-chain amino acid transport system substrate-binding protein
MKKLATMAIAGVMAASPALADLVFPSLSYRTGPYAAGGIPFADGYADYFTLLNERDGGIGGVMTRVVECETAYNTERGVECYEATKGEGALVYQPLSTGITYQLIPRASADGIPIHSMGYGRTSAANGSMFAMGVQLPGELLGRRQSVLINHLLNENGGSLDGKKIALLYHNSAYGREPIRTLETLSEMHGFELLQIAVDSPGQEQGNQWLQIRRERPDYILMWGWGVMNQVAVQEAANIRFPMENFIGIWWSGAEPDVLPAGEGADGLRSLNLCRWSDMPLYDDLQQHVIDAGLAAGDGSNLRAGALCAGRLRRDAGRRSGPHGAGDPRRRGHHARDDARRDGSAGHVQSATRHSAAPGMGPEFSVSCADHRRPGHCRRAAVGLRRAAVGDDHRLHRAR